MIELGGGAGMSLTACAALADALGVERVAGFRLEPLPLHFARYVLVGQATANLRYRDAGVAQEMPPDRPFHLSASGKVATCDGSV